MKPTESHAHWQAADGLHRDAGKAHASTGPGLRDPAAKRLRPAAGRRGVTGRWKSVAEARLDLSLEVGRRVDARIVLPLGILADVGDDRLDPELADVGSRSEADLEAVLVLRV